MPATTKAKPGRHRPVFERVQEPLLQLEAWAPPAYASVVLAVLSLLWALLHLVGHTLLSHSPTAALKGWGWPGATLHAGLKFAFIPSILLGLFGALRDPDTRRAGLVGAGLGLLAIAAWAITGMILKFLNPEGPL